MIVCRPLLLVAWHLVPIAFAADEETFLVLSRDLARTAAAQSTVTAPQALERSRALIPPVAVHELVELIMDGRKPVYEVVFLTAVGRDEVELDARTGEKIIFPPVPNDPADLPKQVRLHAALAGARVTLADAMRRAAEKVPGGLIVKARADAPMGRVEFTVDILVGQEFQAVRLDATGKVLHAGAAPQEPDARGWTFDAMPAGSPHGWTPGFTNTEGARAGWTIEPDEMPMSGPNVLRLRAESASRVFNLLIASDVSLQDVDVRTRLRPDAGREDQGGGVIWRCKDANNYYICRINPLESNYRVYRVVNGKREQLQSVSLPLEAGVWRSIRAKMIGDHVMCFLDGRKLLDVRDGAIRGAGTVGLWTKADASSSFDNVAVRAAVPYPTDDTPAVAPSSAPAGAPGKPVRDQHNDDDD